MMTITAEELISRALASLQADRYELERTIIDGDLPRDAYRDEQAELDGKIRACIALLDIIRGV